MKSKLHHIDIGERSRGHLCLWVPVEPQDNDMLLVRDSVLKAYNEHAALVAVAEAAAKLEHRIKLWQKGVAEGVEVIHCRNELEAELTNLLTVRAGNGGGK